MLQVRHRTLKKMVIFILVRDEDDYLKYNYTDFNLKKTELFYKLLEYIEYIQYI